MNQENTSGGTQPATAPSLLVTQLMENMDTLTKKVSELSQSVANINAALTRDSFGRQRGPCYQCGNKRHIASECKGPRNTGRRAIYRQRQTENYCFVCGNIGHFAREYQFRSQSPVNARSRQGNGQGPPY